MEDVCVFGYSAMKKLCSGANGHWVIYFTLFVLADLAFLNEEHAYDGDPSYLRSTAAVFSTRYVTLGKQVSAVQDRFLM